MYARAQLRYDAERAAGNDASLNTAGSSDQIAEPTAVRPDELPDSASVVFAAASDVVSET